MTKYPCPVCGRRICDSRKNLFLTRLSADETTLADMMIKCRVCKSTIAVMVEQRTETAKKGSLGGDIT